MNRRRFYILLIYLAVALPFIVTGAMQALKVQANSPIDWVSDSFPAKKTYEKFRARFGSGDVVVMSWPGCTLDNERLDALVATLRRLTPDDDEDTPIYFEQVRCGREEYQRLVGEPIRLHSADALKRLRGIFVGPDNRQTSVVVTFNSAGLERRSRIVPWLRKAVFHYCGAKHSDVHMAGPVIDGLSVDVASKAALDRFAPLSALCVFVLCWCCLKSAVAAMLVFGVSVLCQGITLALISWCGDSMSALLIVMPPLIQVLAVAGGIHLTNYYFDAVHSDGRTGAIERAFRLGWLPCTLSATTTAIGLGSLLVSGLLPVRAFGGYAATGVLVTLFVLLSLIPGVLSLRPLTAPASRASASESAGWSRFLQIVSRRRRFIMLGAVPAMVLAGFFAVQLRTSVRIETLFADDSQILADYRWLEDHLGPLVPVEVVVNFDHDCALPLRSRLKLVGSVHHALAQKNGIQTTTSPLNFLPNLSAGTTDNRLRETIVNRQLNAAKPALVAVHYLFATELTESFRVTGYLSALEDIDYGQFLEQLRNDTDLLLKNEGHQLRGVSFEYTGIMPLVHEIQRQLLQDLFSSFITAFVVIAVVMTLVQAGFVAGLIAMIPNVFPTLLVFGYLGWQQFPVDIGSMMTASVALGIAVDDTLHFLTFFRDRLNSGDTRYAAVLSACQHCGRAVLQTTLICGFGLMTFALSAFVPTARFAWMMLALLLTAVVGDLVVLPALLLGSAGKVFEPPESEPPQSARNANVDTGENPARRCGEAKHSVSDIEPSDPSDARSDNDADNQISLDGGIPMHGYSLELRADAGFDVKVPETNL